MKPRLAVLFPLFLSLSCSPPTPSPVSVEEFYSASLGRTQKYTLILPRGFQSGRRYPVLFLLHGYGGGHEDWVSRTSITEYVREFPLIILMPDAGDSWYVNSFTRQNDRFEDFVISDLRTHVLSRFSVDTARMAIAGLSMGGYGAIMLSLRHPGLFRFAGSLSGALSVPRDIDERERKTWGKHNVINLKETFGSSPGPFRDAYDPVLLYRKISPDRLPYLYFVMGTDDGFDTFLPAHRALTDSLRFHGAAYEYHEVPGRHSWQLWDREIGPMIRRMMEVL